MQQQEDIGCVTVAMIVLIIMLIFMMIESSI